jgi:peptide/nickel transport system substrate-binding protein
MKKKIACLTISCLLAAALVLDFCMVAAAKQEGREMVKNSLGKLVPKPKYGGTLVFCQGTNPQGFDDALIPAWNCETVQITNERLFLPDILAGPGGTGEYGWLNGNFPLLRLQRGVLATGWEKPDPITTIYHIRKGVHWHNKPPTNGREFTADDVVYSINRAWSTKTALMHRSYMSAKPVSVKALDRYTVELKHKPESETTESIALGMELTMEYIFFYPREAIEAYGDLSDWRNSVGTGPWMLVDYLPDSGYLFEKNPNYWQMDPFHPENRLPYPDKFHVLVIKDKSTRLAALRTGKIDIGPLDGINWEDHQSLRKTNPELMERRVLNNYPASLFFRCDKPELPWYDHKVRRALTMAIDYKSIVDDYYNGEAEALAAPTQPTPDLMFSYTPIEELPPECREMFQYNPEKAKKLLAEAGYPKGFKFKVLTTSPGVDEVSILKAFLTNIGVDLEIDVREAGVVGSIARGHKVEQTLWGVMATGSALWKFNSWRWPSLQNAAMVNDPVVNNAYSKVYAWSTYKNDEVRAKIYKDTYRYIQCQAWAIPFPVPYIYFMWQPWVGNYHGEKIGHGGQELWTAFPWVDKDMKANKKGG